MEIIKDSNNLDKKIELSINKILEEYDLNKKLYNSFVKRMSNLLEDLIAEKINIHVIKNRVKEKDSLIEKIKLKARGDKRKLYENINEITDICGIRIIVLNSHDINKVVKIIENEFKIDKNNTIDKRRKETDKFGYLSYHQIVELDSKRIKSNEYRRFKNLKFEIQTRTVLQHAWAEIEHDLGYKNKEILSEKDQRHIYMLSATLELVDKEFSQLQKNKNKKQKVRKMTKINEYSLLKIIIKNKIINNLDNCIIQNTHDYINYGHYSTTFIIKTIILLDIQTIEELEKLLIKYEDELEIFIQQFNYKRLAFNKSGLCLIYLCIYLAMERYKKEDFMEYLNDLNIEHVIDLNKQYETIENSYNRVQMIKKLNLKGRI